MAEKIPNLEARAAFKKRSLFGLGSRPLQLFCGHCDTLIPTSSDWRCGYCSHENRRARVFSFLDRCQKCERPPSAYVCPHCSKANFLEPGNDSSNAARLIPPPPPPAIPPPPAPPEEDPRKKKQRAHLERKQDLEWEAELAALEVKLAQIKEPPTERAKSQLQSAIDKSFAEQEARFMGIHEKADKMLAEYAERFKDNPDMLERGRDFVARWLESQME